MSARGPPHARLLDPFEVLLSGTLKAVSSETASHTRRPSTKEANKDRKRSEGHDRLVADYFGGSPTYNERQFRTRYRISRRLFARITDALRNNRYFMQVKFGKQMHTARCTTARSSVDASNQKADATGLVGLSPEQKCTAALRILAYGIGADAVDEYVRLSKSTASECLHEFCLAIVEAFSSTYLRKPTEDDIQQILAVNEGRGFPGMLGSLDCTHWEWKNCPVAWHGQ